MSWSTARAPWGGRPAWGSQKLHKHDIGSSDETVNKKPNMKNQPASSSALRPQEVTSCMHTHPPGERRAQTGAKDPAELGPRLVCAVSFCACMRMPGQSQFW